MVNDSDSSSNACPWENGNGVQITGTTGKHVECQVVDDQITFKREHS